MTVNELLCVIDEQENIYISDYEKPIDQMSVYSGFAGKLKERSESIGSMRVVNISYSYDALLILATSR